MDKTDIHRIWIDDKAIWIEKTDGQRGCEYLENYSRLRTASQKDLQAFTLSYYGIHWPELDEDLSFDGFFAKTGARV